MTLTWLGRIALYIALAGSLFGLVTQVGALRRGRAAHAFRWALVSLLGIAAAVAVMQFALITHNFSLAYVAENNATFTPLLYSITGMWSALEGSLLLWSLLLGGLVVAVVRYYRAKADDAVVGWATAVLFAVSTVAGLYWLTSGGHHFAWRSPASAALLAVSLVALTARSRWPSAPP